MYEIRSGDSTNRLRETVEGEKASLPAREKRCDDVKNKILLGGGILEKASIHAKYILGSALGKLEEKARDVSNTVKNVLGIKDKAEKHFEEYQVQHTKLESDVNNLEAKKTVSLTALAGARTGLTEVGNYLNEIRSNYQEARSQYLTDLHEVRLADNKYKLAKENYDKAQAKFNNAKDSLTKNRNLGNIGRASQALEKAEQQLNILKKEYRESKYNYDTASKDYTNRQNNLDEAVTQYGDLIREKRLEKCQLQQTDKSGSMDELNAAYKKFTEAKKNYKEIKKLYSKEEAQFSQVQSQSKRLDQCRVELDRAFEIYENNIRKTRK